MANVVLSSTDCGLALKKLTFDQRAWFAKKAQWGNEAKFKSGERSALKWLEQRNLKLKADAAFDKIRSLLPPPIERTLIESRMKVTEPPARLDLHENYDETLSFLLELRNLHRPRRVSVSKNQSKRWRRLINLARIEDIDPATGLVLAAELDTIRRSLRDLKSQDETWHENVRSYFLESGLFELLNIPPQTAHTKPPAGQVTQVLKYRKGDLPDGEQADRLRHELETLCGESFGPRVAVNKALCEAMTNAHHHAYPPGHVWSPMSPQENWWATCAWTPATGTMHMMLYDQGVGIPATLPRSQHWASALPILDLLDPERSDAGLIQAALELRRTSTNIYGRGRGLYEMADWIEKTESGFLRILSGKGSVTYRPGKQVKRAHLTVPFCGTLVEWEIQRGS